MKKIIEYVKNNYSDIITECSKYVYGICIIIYIIWKFKSSIKKLFIDIGFSEIYLNSIIKYFKFIFLWAYRIAFVYSIFLICYIVIKKILILVCRNKQKDEYNKMLKNDKIDGNKRELYKNLYKYFSEKDNDMPIFISGEWGAGKTYTIEYFLENYYKYSKQKIYKISCFGITTKENLMERIKNVCENTDKSILKRIIYIIGEVPIVGELLKKILERKYDINSIKKNSIFIFDNFERIEWASIENEQIRKLNYNNAITKYDIVSGVIDDLIENYNMKVVIIGNKKEMVPEYAYNTFICKLGCKNYNINPQAKVFCDIWYQVVNREINTEKYKKEIENIFKEVELSSDLIWNLSRNENIRVLHKCIYNYIEFIMYLWENNYEFKNGFNEKISIYYTNLILNLDNTNLFKDIKTYESISSYFGKKSIREKNSKYMFLDTINAMWCADQYSKELYKNLEQNHSILLNYERNISKEYIKRYISKRNCGDKNLQLEIVEFEDLAFLLRFSKNMSVENLHRWIDKNIINISNKDNVVDIIETYKLHDKIINDDLLMNYIFKKDKNDSESELILNYEKFCQKSLSFKIIYNKYKEINSSK